MTAAALIAAARALSDTVAPMRFAPPVTHVYNPLDYAWNLHERYLARYGDGPKRVVFLGMNPGPFGMAQTGVPFGEIAAVRDWLELSGEVEQPAQVNPKRPVEGFACSRSEVSGRRLWGLFHDRFGTADAFFAEHFVANYCPLAFFVEGRNLTPDKLPEAEQKTLLAACDDHLRALVAACEPEWVIGIGAWAEARAQVALESCLLNHDHCSPSPAPSGHPLPQVGEGKIATLLQEHGKHSPSPACGRGVGERAFSSSFPQRQESSAGQRNQEEESASTKAHPPIKTTLKPKTVRIGRILHPSPASPAANRGWAEAASRQLAELGVWA